MVDATHPPVSVNRAESRACAGAGGAQPDFSLLRSKADPGRPVRVLLIQLPFFRLTAPSISLATLESSLVRAGVSCDVLHLNLDFGRRIGKERYNWLAVGSPPYLLVGDLLFAPSLNGTPPDPDHVARLVASLGTRLEAGVPDWVVHDFGEIAVAAEEFLEHHVRAIPWHEYDLVGLTTIFNVAPALALARRIKRLPHAPAIVLGGSNCEGEMGEVLHREFPFVDFVCRGEGEELLVELARSFGVGQPPPPSLPGLVMRQGGRTLADPRRAQAAQLCLDELPIPRYDRWMEEVRCSGMFREGELQLPIETSRGCWYGEKRNCVFCGLNGQGMAYRRKSSERILDEFRGVVGTGVKVFHCVDNILDPHYFQDVLPRLAELAHGCEIFWPARPNLDRDQLALLVRSGVCWVQVGIESLSTPILELMGKGTTALQNVRLLRDAAEIGVGASWNVLFGFVGEDPDAYRQMAGLMPDLTHLQPPRMSYQIRMDRFSPLFDRRHRLKNVAPARAYRDLFPLEAGTLERLAYYFDYEYADQPDPFSYVGPCLEAMASWRREVGRAALISFDSGDALHVCDSRAVATGRHASLRGVERDVLTAARQGLDGDALAARVGASPGDVQAAVRTLLDRRWLALLDGRYLALNVPVDGWLPPGVPPLMVRDSLEALYRSRMLRLCDASSGTQPLPAATSAGAEAPEADCP